MQVYDIPQLINLYLNRDNGAQILLSDHNVLFTSARFDSENWITNNLYTFNISNNTLLREENIIQARVWHGL